MPVRVGRYTLPSRLVMAAVTPVARWLTTRRENGQRRRWRAAKLTDPSLPKAEREGFAHLFAGAVGAYKNPHSQRKVAIDDLREAQRQVILASHCYTSSMPR